MTSDSERKSVKATVTPRKDNTNPKPLLTRREIEHERQVLNEMEKFREIDSVLPKVKVGAFIDGQNKRLDCIEAMAKLLERLVYLYGDDAYIPNALQDAKDLLSTFNATGGEGS